MARRITPEKIATFKQYWIDRYSLPEIASMCQSTVATVRKYLKSDIETYINEYTEAAKRRAETSMTYGQFETYAEYCLAECDNDLVGIKSVYYELKEDAKDDCRKVTRLRELYEARLNQVKISETEQYTSSTSNADIIRQYRLSLNCKIPISKGCNSWGHERLVEHLTYWKLKSNMSHNKAIAWLEEHPTTKNRQDYLNEKSNS